jgi:two-component system nitrate/nitrite response regulator NarL
MSSLSSSFHSHLTPAKYGGVMDRATVLVADDHPHLREGVVLAVEAGASGYVTKDASQEQIALAIRAVSLGKMQMSPEPAGGLARQIRRSAHNDSPILSERERQVLVLHCHGLSAPQIAQRLLLGTSTIKPHLAHLYAKLGVTDRAAAVAQAMRRGLVE